MPKTSLKSDVITSIDEYEVVSVLQQIMQTSQNDSARVTAATRLLDHLKENKMKSEGIKIYDQLINFKDESDKTRDQLESIS